MNRKRLKLLILVIILAAVTVWLVGFYWPQPGYVQVLRADPGSRKLHVIASWETCQTGSATMDERSDRIEVTVTRRNEWCHIYGPQSGQTRTYRWTLDKRLGDRQIIDARTGKLARDADA